MSTFTKRYAPNSAQVLKGIVVQANQIARLIAVVLVVSGFMAILMRHNPEMPVIMGTVVATMVLIYLIFAFPKAVAFINRYPNRIRVAGIFSLASGILWIPAAFFIFRDMKQATNLVTGVVLGTTMFGSLLITLPRSVKRADEFKRQIAKNDPAAALRASGFSGVAEGVASNRYVAEHILPFLQIAGPWVVLNEALPLIALQVAAQRSGVIQSVIVKWTPKMGPGA